MTEPRHPQAAAGEGSDEYVDGTSRNAAHAISIPRSLAITIGAVLWPVMIVVLHGLVPQRVSLLTERHGWVAGRPGIWNAGGLLMVAWGGGLLIWVLATHLTQIPKRVRIELRAPWELTLPYLVASGPYRFSRHPMYVAILALWFGWARFYGSGTVMIGALVLVIAINLVVRREERALEMRFGDAYRHYKTAVPRWFGTRQSRASIET